MWTVAPFINHALKAILYQLHSFVETTIAWSWPTQWRRKERSEYLRRILEDDSPGSSKLVSLRKNIDIEDDFANDTHSEGDHLLIEVDDCPIVPFLLNLFPIVSYAIHIVSNLTRLKGRGHQLALPTVNLSFTDEETIACKGLMHQLTLVKIISKLD